MANTSKRLGTLTNTTPSGGGGGGSSYATTFNLGSWISSGSDYVISISEAIHLMGTDPIVQVYELEGVTYKLVIVPVDVSNAGLVTIRVPQVPDNRFSGKITIS
jgi:hypothetical protein